MDKRLISKTNQFYTGIEKNSDSGIILHQTNNSMCFVALILFFTLLQGGEFYRQIHIRVFHSSDLPQKKKGRWELELVRC